jgi:protein SCO1
MTQKRVHQLLWGVLASVMLGVAAMGLWTGIGAPSKRERGEKGSLAGLDVFGTVPNFSLTAQSGERFGLADLDGKIWIADFIYTSCTDTCPLQSAALAKLQGELPKNDLWRVVSFSVDPDHDTPAVLSRYAARFGANPERWLFLTGDKKEIYRLAHEGFRLAVAAPPGASGQTGSIVAHSSRFVLLDGRGQVRGYYDSRDADALKRLERDINQLIKRTA